MSNANKLMEITREACAMIHERLPENDYIVSVFQEKGDGVLGQTLQGRVENKSLIALVNAIINELARQTGKTREQIFDTLKRSGDPTKRTVDYRRKSYEENEND